MAIHVTQTLTVSIDAPFVQVASDLANPRTHPEWAKEFFAGEAQPLSDDEVQVLVPMMGGRMKYRVASDLENGILNLYLARPDESYGSPIPVRLLHNGDGVDVLWTLTCPPGLPEMAWQQGLDSMKRELSMLKQRHEHT